ncbi:hypothetical protein QJS10_CPA09g00945 [Acorus calamus]|uniref:ARM repeat superfamily protein n=1 Tax=Acorus calamus TaxID=4465 RepID=A0AAV9E6G0_ACOCL|nr:hypothetical protein QJS10_CPA09g00945 [Acorus calamus]
MLVSDGTEEDAKMEMTFSSLKHYCMGLLDLLRNPRTSAPFLPEMADFLRSSPAESLQPSLDYILLPFLLLVDAAVQCRSRKKVDPQQNITTITISDNVAEGMLLGLEELLKKCHLGSVDQMVVVLKKLSYGAMLTPSEAAEEFHEGIISKEWRTMEDIAEFIPTAEIEAARGHHGSAKLRSEALLTLRVFVAKVGTADALAFFLPGVVSCFAKFLHVSKAARVRLALVDGIKSLMSKCRYTLNKSKLMLLECLCVLAYDDSELVSVAAQESLEILFMLREKYLSENEVAEIFNRLIEKLHKVVLGSEKSIVVSHAQKLLAVMYYAGPENVVDHLLRSSLTAVRSLDYLTLSLSPNSLFAGSVGKLITLKPLSSGYLHSISELRAGAHLSCADSSIVNSAPSSFSLRQYQSANIYEKLFHKSGNKMKEVNIKSGDGEAGIGHVGIPGHTAVTESVWNVYQHKDARSHVIDCVGSILHEYLSSEIWDLASDQKSFHLAQDMETENLSPHFFRDIANLHQVIIDGIGIFSISLGNDFISSGFLHSSLYLLLQNLICSNYQIRSASDVVLRVLSASSDFPTVGHLVLANSDYIIDSLCRQLRHLDLNPHVPDVLGSMLSYIGAAHKILPLLEEPV